MTAADAETAWYLDRRKSRVVTVRHGVVNDPLLRARDVEDDEIRFVEVPAVTDGEIHEWMAEFVEESASAEAAAALDERPGANARFEERLRKSSPEVLTEWHRFRKARVAEVAAQWTDETLDADVPPGTGLSGDD